MPWIVAMTKPNNEEIACENLKRQAFEHYCPRFLQKCLNKDPVVRPLFPRYLFVLIMDRWYPNKNTRGISTILMGDTAPLTLGQVEIDKLRCREDNKGLVQLHKLDKFKRNDSVKTEQGPLAGHLLVYEGMRAHERVSCLFNVLGRQSRTWVNEGDLVAA